MNLNLTKNEYRVLEFELIKYKKKLSILEWAKTSARNPEYSKLQGLMKKLNDFSKNQKHSSSSNSFSKLKNLYTNNF